LVLGLILVSQSARGAEPPADLVVLNGRIVTVDARSSIVEAAGIRDGRFVAVGANAEVKKLVGDRTRVIYAGGKTVVPGLIETHVHALGGTGRSRAAVRATRFHRGNPAMDWRQAQTTPEGEWIQIPESIYAR
jgi:predicted amidohydrolase YtcJ